MSRKNTRFSTSFQTDAVNEPKGPDIPQTNTANEREVHPFFSRKKPEISNVNIDKEMGINAKKHRDFESKMFQTNKNKLVCKFCNKKAMVNKGGAGNVNQGGLTLIQLRCSRVLGGCDKTFRLAECLTVSGLDDERMIYDEELKEATRIGLALKQQKGSRAGPTRQRATSAPTPSTNSTNSNTTSKKRKKVIVGLEDSPEDLSDLDNFFIKRKPEQVETLPLNPSQNKESGQLTASNTDPANLNASAVNAVPTNTITIPATINTNQPNDSPDNINRINYLEKENAILHKEISRLVNLVSSLASKVEQLQSLEGTNPPINSGSVNGPRPPINVAPIAQQCEPTVSIPNVTDNENYMPSTDPVTNATRPRPPSSNVIIDHTDATINNIDPTYQEIPAPLAKILKKLEEKIDKLASEKGQSLKPLEANFPTLAASYKQIATKGVDNNTKFAKFVKRKATKMVLTPSDPLEFSKVYIKIHDNRLLKRCKSAKEKNILIKQLLKNLKINQHVFMCSRIGNSILELYVNNSKLRMVAEALASKDIDPIDINVNIMPMYAKSNDLNIVAKRIAGCFEFAKLYNLKKCVLAGISPEVLEMVGKITDITKFYNKVPNLYPEQGASNNPAITPIHISISADVEMASQSSQSPSIDLKNPIAATSPSNGEVAPLEQ